MSSKKWVHSFFFYGMSFVGAVLFVILVTSSAGASERTPPPATEQDQHQRQGQHQAQGQGQGQTATGTGTASAQGTGSATNEGNNNTTNNSSQFFAFSSRLPGAGECFGAVEGGGGSGSGGGFLGWRPLNNDCWFSALAEAEENVQVRARLKCASKMFRNAISYTEKKSERQTHCVGYMVRTYVEQIEHERSQVQAMLDAQTLIISDHVTTATERTTDTLTRVVETCSDCYGEGSK